jgi:hypothetical protein
MPLQPILVTMVWRGGARLERCLRSIAASKQHFSRVLVSVTSAETSEDMRLARAFAREQPGVEVICTGSELPTMQHQAFWVDHLERTGAQPSDWVYWLSYDDEVRLTGIEAIVDSKGNWPLVHGTAYLGPWAMRHESAEHLFDGPWNQPLESWTSFPIDGPTRLPVPEWICEQVRQPTYMQMSGSVCPLESFQALRDRRPRKRGPMRIEMAIASAPPSRYVEEFSEPVSVIYGRSNSDRANYGQTARKEDVHLAAWLTRFAGRRPAEWKRLAAIGGTVAKTYAQTLIRHSTLPQEQWRVRDIVPPDATNPY